MMRLSDETLRNVRADFEAYLDRDDPRYPWFVATVRAALAMANAEIAQRVHDANFALRHGCVYLQPRWPHWPDRSS